MVYEYFFNLIKERTLLALKEHELRRAEAGENRVITFGTLFSGIDAFLYGDTHSMDALREVILGFWRAEKNRDK